MNREIKFRGFESECTDFVVGSYATDGKDYHAILIEHEEDESQMRNIPIDAETVGQFTGLTDVDGKEVYEGDILLCKTNCMHDDGSRKKCLVEFSGGSFKCDGVSLPMLIIDFNAEIVGNIHQNPELLK